MKAVDIPADKVRDRVFYGATGRTLVTAGQVAKMVKCLISSADIRIGSGLSEADLIEARFRGVLSIENASEQLGYKPQFAELSITFDRKRIITQLTSVNFASGRLHERKRPVMGDMAPVFDQVMSEIGIRKFQLCDFQTSGQT